MIPSKCGLPPGAAIFVLCQPLMSFLRAKAQQNASQSENQLSKRIFSDFPPAFPMSLCLDVRRTGKASLLADSSLPGNTLPRLPHVLCGCVNVCVCPPNTNTHSYMHVQAFTETLSLPGCAPPSPPQPPPASLPERRRFMSG